MAASRLYVLDTNIMVTAHRSYYAFDIAPGFWSGLIDAASSDKVLSISQVMEDLKRGHNPKNPDEDDPLTIWACDQFRPFFKKTDEEDVTRAYTEIDR